MKAVVLAGGFGTRLASVVKNVPKPLAPIEGKPFLSILLDDLKKQGVTDVVLAVHYLKEKIFDYFKFSYNGMNIKYSEEEKPLGTGGGLQKALKFYPEEEPVICLNGDSFIEISYRDLMTNYKVNTLDLCVGLRFVDNCDRYGQAHIEKEKIIKFTSKGSSLPGIVNAGIYVLSLKLFHRMDLPESFSFEKEVLQERLNQLKCGYVVSKGKFLDIGIPEAYKKSKSFFRNILSTAD